MIGFEKDLNLRTTEKAKNEDQIISKSIKSFAMRTTHSFAVNLIRRNSNTDKNHALLYARITVDGKRAEISLKEKILIKDWDGKKEVVRGKSIEVRQLNQHLDEVRYQIKSKYRLLQEYEALITAESIKQAYVGVHQLQKGHTLLELTEYFKKIWSDKLSYGSYKNYKTTIDYIKLFIRNHYDSKEIYLSQLSIELVTEFEHYIRHSPIKAHDPCLGNGTAKHIQRFKRLINWALELKWIKFNPVESYSCPIKKNKRKKLTIQQLVMLEEKNFQDVRLQYAKDLFLFSCYTGFAFVDVMQLHERHFEWDIDGTVWCKIYRQKSDILSPVPLLKNAVKIIDRYKNTNYNETINVFPSITNQDINRRLKVIQESCEIDIPISFHIARHTFAKTVALKNGIPLETVQLLIGHTKITTTQIYADVDEEKIIQDMNGLDEKLELKRHIILHNATLKET